MLILCFSHQSFLQNLLEESNNADYVERKVLDIGLVYNSVFPSITNHFIKSKIQNVLLENYDSLVVFLIDKDLEKALGYFQASLNLRKSLNETYKPQEQNANRYEEQQKFFNNFSVTKPREQLLKRPGEQLPKQPCLKKKIIPYSELVHSPSQVVTEQNNSETSEKKIPYENQEKEPFFVALFNEKIDRCRTIQGLINRGNSQKLELLCKDFVQTYQGIDSLLRPIDDKLLYIHFQTIILENYYATSKKLLHLQVPQLACTLLSSLSQLSWRIDPIETYPNLLVLKEELLQIIRLHANQKSRQELTIIPPTKKSQPSQEVIREELVVQRIEEDQKLTPVHYLVEIENDISSFLKKKDKELKDFLFMLNTPLTRTPLKRIFNKFFNTYLEIDFLLSFFDNVHYCDHAKNIVENYYMVVNYLFNKKKIKASKKIIDHLYQFKWRFPPHDLLPELAIIEDQIRQNDNTNKWNIQN